MSNIHECSVCASPNYNSVVLIFKSRLLLSNFLFHLLFNLDWISIQTTVLVIFCKKHFLNVFETHWNQSTKTLSFLLLQYLLGDKSVFYHSWKFMSLLPTVTLLFHSPFKKLWFAKTTAFLVPFRRSDWHSAHSWATLPQTGFLILVMPSYFLTFYAAKTMQNSKTVHWVPKLRTHSGPYLQPKFYFGNPSLLPLLAFFYIFNTLYPPSCRRA